MTPAEIQSTIEQMLSVQRQIQESQIKNTDNIARLESQTQSNGQLIRENSQSIRENSQSIRGNSQLIRGNSQLIRENSQSIRGNSQSIRGNSQSIREEGELIREFASDTRADIALLVEEIAKLAVDQREKFNQFYGYHIAADSDRLNIIERLNKVEQEVRRLKGRLDNESN